MSPTFSGEGPGSRTLDGCSVELYRQMPYLGELDDIIALIAPGSTALELGCGTGRLCRRLVEAGCSVTGVDASAAMLASLPPGIEGVQSTVEDLALGRSFDVVLLSSHLINHPDAALRQAFVRCARRHLRDGGRFFLQRHNVRWLQSVQVGWTGQAAEVSMAVESVTREAGLVRMRLRYETSGQTWTHSFSVVALSDVDIEKLLAAAGFDAVRWHGQQTPWASAAAGPAS